VSIEFPSAESVPAPPDRQHGLRTELRLLLVLILAGGLLAFAWRLLTPYGADLGDEQEAAAAVDGTLALLGVAFGALTAIFVLLRPGPTPALRTVTVILGSLLGGLVSWLLGDQLGTPALRAVGAAFTWPIATSGFLFFGALLPGTSHRLLSPVRSD
jgi:hypothetical protein